MKLNAILTFGWQDDPTQPAAARTLHEAAKKASGDYDQALIEAVKKLGSTPVIGGLERLFRKRANGFGDIKDFVGTLSLTPLADVAVQCHIDVFAYAFLKGAKNFDLLLPENPAKTGPFRDVQPYWDKIIAALEELERRGQPLPPDLAVSKGHYLALREVLARPSTRDEKRALATLLYSGPSTLAEIAADLGMNYSLSQRTIGVFTANGTVEERARGVYAIVETALPLVVFCLRETMGLEPLSQV